MVSGEIPWPPTTGTQWRVLGVTYTLDSIREGVEEAILTPIASEGRTSEGLKVLKEEWEDFTDVAVQVSV